MTELSDAGVGAASQRIAAHLREAILSGEIVPGQWIRQEEVAARLGASRLPVREALRMLEAEGLTEHEANKGSRVPLLAVGSPSTRTPCARRYATAASRSST